MDVKRRRLPFLPLLLWFLHLPYARLYAQTDYPDSLMTALKQAKEDSVKSWLLMQLSDYWSDKNPVQGVLFAERAIACTKKGHVQRGIGYFYLGGAYFSYDRTKSQQAYLYADQLLLPFKTSDALQYRSRVWHNYGVLEQHKGNSKGFVDILLTKAIPLARAAGDNLRVAWGYMDLGAVFMNFKDYPKANEYYEKALTILNSKEQYRMPVLAECYLNKAKSYILQDIPDSAKSSLEQAHLILKTHPDRSYLPFYHLVLGMYYSRKTQWSRAIAELNDGLIIAEQEHRPYEATSILYEKYEVYKRQGQLKKAKLYIEKVYARQQDFPIANNARMLLYELAQTESGLGNYKMAFERLSQYTKLSDSFFSEKAAQEIANLEARNRLATKENELLGLQHHYQLQRLFLYFSAGILLLLIIFGVYFFIHKKKRDLEHARVLQHERQVEVARAQLEGEERERRRVARDLHDGLGGMLASVKLNLSAVSNKSKAYDSGELNEVISQLDVSVDELRRIARNMMPETLLRAGMVVALTDLCKWVNNAHFTVKYEMLNIDESIALQQKVDIYRIVQELLSNAVKHSEGTEVFVQCSMHKKRFYITVEDNGKGVQHGDWISATGMGLENVRSRVAYMLGKIEYKVIPDLGTIINIEVNVE